MHRDEDLAGGSESWHDISCTICESDDRHVEAAAHCKECRMWLCDRCLKLHNRFPAIRNHHIESVNRSANGNGETAAIIRGPSNFKFVYHASVHFSTDVKNREISRNDNASNLKSRFEIHEQRARAIEACRKRADQKEELTLQALLLLPLDISAAPQSTDLLPVYRTGEVQLTLKGEKGLFKYGSGVYDLEKFNQIVTPRIAEFRKYSTTINLHEGIGHFYSTPRPNYGYVIYSARDSGVTKHDLEKVLNACHVADVKDRERHYVLRQMRDEIYDLLNGDEGYAINVHFRKLLLRWLANIPKHLNEQTICGGDLNDVPFPIPDDIRRDCYLLSTSLRIALDDVDAGVFLPELGGVLESCDGVANVGNVWAMETAGLMRMCESCDDPCDPVANDDGVECVAWRGAVNGLYAVLLCEEQNTANCQQHFMSPVLGRGEVAKEQVLDYQPEGGGSRKGAKVYSNEAFIYIKN
ncbi:hypothetical protein MAR_001129 [Mya arenaria]|uniref:B box-type domain-containing protein n=1 Tax=Mya arenaria TaxID=6604 RepID=A0ABY7FEA1_MYAAR|nr:hypothetical protein MAR_001129 [Mya arenaria]